LADLETVLLGLSLACIALATLGYLLSLFVQKIQFAKFSTWVLAAGFVLLTLNLLTAAFQPAVWGGFGSRRFLSIYAWAIAGIYLGLQFKTRTRVLGAFIAPLILLFLIIAAGQESGKNLVPPDWQGWLTALHLVMAIAGEALFVLACGAGAMYLIQNNLIKHKRPGKMSHVLPSLGDLDRINAIGLLWGFVFLTLGMIGGAVFAAFVWKDAWISDPKVIWAFAMWVVYGVLLHQRLAIGWKGVRMAVLSCAVFLLLILSALIVRFCLSTVHNFI